jgi:hypothetical protein
MSDTRSIVRQPRPPPTTRGPSPPPPNTITGGSGPASRAPAGSRAWHRSWQGTGMAYPCAPAVNLLRPGLSTCRVVETGADRLDTCVGGYPLS